MQRAAPGHVISLTTSPSTSLSAILAEKSSNREKWAGSGPSVKQGNIRPKKLRRCIIQLPAGKSSRRSVTRPVSLYSKLVNQSVIQSIKSDRSRRVK